MSVSSLTAEAVEQHLIVPRKKLLGKKALAQVGQVHVGLEVNDLIEERRRDDES